MKYSKGLLVDDKVQQGKDSSFLVSKVIKVEPEDCLAFFANYSSYKGKRFFWKDPASENILIGIGKCKEIYINNHKDLYTAVEQRWRKFLENSRLMNDFNRIGVGPTLFGGFSFDPEKQKTELWESFADAHFFVPEFMLSEINGEQFLTVNMVMDETDAIYEQKIEDKLSLFFHHKETVKPYIERNPLIKSLEVDGEYWKDVVGKVVKSLNSTLKKVVLARECRLVFKEEIQTESVLDQLLREQNNSYIFALEEGDNCFIGATPERLVKKTGNEVLSTCLAGSIPRGEDEAKDQELGAKLLADEKNRTEHQYVVNMIQSAMEMVCRQVEIPTAPILMKMRDIQHLYTPVKGILKEKESLIELIRLLHPTPALGGFPKMLAIEKIREEEQLDRGLYGAPLGWIDYQGNGEFAVSIRSGLIQKNEASIFAGCGIVANSDVELEYKETAMKFRPMQRALGGKQ
ncbi:isochorismate synthase MenF [Niallia sp. NCCP-28]|uniref:isochorismate synthase n=1 Tax=Niallia sp. NCCP-28 TaxID=2934712 RepID=UPI002084EB76|nr:isochorismate synthase [Niallia sp. NCCP-28]GKU84789.1 isochorismate synthase MenF [Niallia sp. NCCP-28]